MGPIEIIVSLCSGLVGAWIGGYIASHGAVKSVVKLEELRRSEKLRTLFRGILREIDTINHPAGVVDRIAIDDAVSDYVSIILCTKTRKQFEAAWHQYRYDPKNNKYPPSEYTTNGIKDSRKLISERIHKLISSLK